MLDNITERTRQEILDKFGKKAIARARWTARWRAVIDFIRFLPELVIMGPLFLVFWPIILAGDLWDNYWINRKDERRAILKFIKEKERDKG
jgi:hypothetical protein